MYRERNRIERMIGHLKINSAIATRYDKLARSFLDALHIAAIRRRLLRLSTRLGGCTSAKLDANVGATGRLICPTGSLRVKADGSPQ
jgi:Transposase DDE domain